MKNLYQTPVLMDLVVNAKGTVDQLPHARLFANHVSHAWEPAQQVDVV